MADTETTEAACESVPAAESILEASTPEINDEPASSTVCDDMPSAPTASTASIKTTAAVKEELDFDLSTTQSNTCSATGSTPYADPSSLDRNYTNRLYEISGAYSSAVRDNIYTKEALLANRSDYSCNPRLSKRSRTIIRQGFDLGFSAPGLRNLYDVIFLPCVFYI